MELSDAYLQMIWEEIERIGAWDCEAYAIRNTLMMYPGF